MKILQIYTDLRVGGIQRFVLDLSQELGKEHEVILLTTWSESVDQISVGKPNFRRIALGKTSGGFSLALLFRIAWIILKERPDVVHTHLFTLVYAAPLMLFGLPFKTKYVHTVHSMADKEMPGLYRFKKFVYRWRTIPVSISEAVQESVEKLFSFSKGTSPLIYNGVAVDFKQQLPEDKLSIIKKLQENGRIFVSVGNLSKNKNQLMLNRVAVRLEKEGYQFSVIIAGRNDDAEYTKQFLAEKSGSVYYIEMCPQPQALLREADFFTLSSTYEGMPISLLEALSCGCVPVCVPAGGIPSGCIHHRNGLLAEDISEDALYEVMKEALELSSGEYEEYRQASLKLFADKFSMEKCADEYVKLYRGNKTA